MLPPGGGSQPPPAPAERMVDLLVDLPSEVLDKILSGLPARDVVCTSVLSPPWRRRWETVPGLDVELHDVPDDDIDEHGGGWGSAARFLEHCAGPVGRVSIRGVPSTVCHRADDWVRAVAEKSPRSLCLQLPVTQPLPSLFGGDTARLTELELCRGVIPAPPAGFAWFPKLTKLDLDDVSFVGENGRAQLEAMVAAAAPTLVELRLQNIVAFPVGEHGSVKDRWVIQAPNLRQLVLCLSIAGAGSWELGPLPNLESARIFLTDPAEDRDYTQMFTAISNVRMLHIGNFHINTQAAAMGIFQDILFRFKNLKILRHDGNLNNFRRNHLFRRALFCHSSPSLETIEIKTWY